MSHVVVPAKDFVLWYDCCNVLSVIPYDVHYAVLIDLQIRSWDRGEAPDIIVLREVCDQFDL